MDPALFFTKDGILSPRVGADWMDGRSILIGRPRKYIRPWNHCIAFDQLTNDNLPPFNVRLQDDQVGHLMHFARFSRKTIAVYKLAQWWSWDFSTTGATSNISLSRDSWGPAYTGPTTYTKDRSLAGGETLPEYVDPCLPLTYTSCDRIMPQGTSGLKNSAPNRHDIAQIQLLELGHKKREASEDLDQKEGREPKRSCADAPKSQESTHGSCATFETKPRLFVDNLSINKAISYYELLTDCVRRSQPKIVALEADIEAKEKQAKKDFESLEAGWKQRVDEKNEEIEKLKVELLVSDGLLKSSQATVAEQDRKLLQQQRIQTLLKSKHRTVQAQKKQLARWEAQARAMLGRVEPERTTDEDSPTQISGSVQEPREAASTTDHKPDSSKVSSHTPKTAPSSKTIAESKVKATSTVPSPVRVPKSGKKSSSPSTSTPSKSPHLDRRLNELG